MNKLKFIIFLLLVLVMNMTNQVWADEDPGQGGTPSATFKVEGVSNVIDRLKEKIDLFFKFSSEDKISYQTKLVEKRLAELEYIINSGQGDMVEEVSSRYSTYVGRLSSMILENNQDKMKGKKEEFIRMYDRHLKVLDRLERNFEFGTGLWRLVEYDIDTVKIFSGKIRSI